MTRPLVCLLMLLPLLWCCQPRQVRGLPPLGEEGEVYVFLQPLPQEAVPFTFTIDKVTALGASGDEIPLLTEQVEVTGTGTRRQRLAASGRLSPGTYRGFSITIGKANLRTDEGVVSLAVSTEGVPVTAPFTVLRKRATVLFLELDPRSLAGDAEFSPVFHAVTPPGKLTGLTGYVSNATSHTITVFDKKSGQVTDVIATGQGPMGMAFDQKLMRAYVALEGDDAVEVIDIATGSPFMRIRLLRGDSPREVALTPDGRTLITVNSGSDSVSFVDTPSLSERVRIRVGGGPNSVIIDGAGRRAYVFNTLSNTVSVIDIQRQTPVATIATEAAPLRGQLSARAESLYVIHEWSPYLLVVDLQTLGVRNRVLVGMGAQSVKVNRATELFYLGKRHEAAVDVYSPFTRLPIDVIPAAGGVRHMAIDGEENTLCLLVPGKKRLTVHSIVGRKVLFDLDVGEGAYWVSVMGEQ